MKIDIMSAPAWDLDAAWNIFIIKYLSKKGRQQFESFSLSRYCLSVQQSQLLTNSQVLYDSLIVS